MTNIRPGSDFPKKYQEISEFCHRYQEPMFLTKDGAGDTVVLSVEAYQKLTAKVEIYNLLGEALESERKNGLIPLDEAMAEIESGLRNENL